MGLVTIFLLTTISILLLGHAMMFLTKEDNLPHFTDTKLVSVPVNETPKRDPTSFSVKKTTPDIELLGELKTLKTKVGVIDEKATMAHSRISDLEEEYVESTMETPKQFNPLDLKQFRANIEIEMNIIRQILEEMDLENNQKKLLRELDKKQKKFEHESIDDLMTNLKKKNNILNGVKK